MTNKWLLLEKIKCYSRSSVIRSWESNRSINHSFSSSCHISSSITFFSSCSASSHSITRVVSWGSTHCSYELSCDYSFHFSPSLILQYTHTLSCSSEFWNSFWSSLSSFLCLYFSLFSISLSSRVFWSILPWFVCHTNHGTHFSTSFSSFPSSFSLFSIWVLINSFLFTRQSIILSPNHPNNRYIQYLAIITRLKHKTLSKETILCDVYEVP